jgi:hypothetical protein
MQGLMACHWYDISHRNVALSNLRLLPTTQPVFNFVFIDWTAATSITYKEQTNKVWQNTESGYLEMLLEALDPETAAIWAATENGQKMWKLVEMGPKKLVEYEASSAPP